MICIERASAIGKRRRFLPAQQVEQIQRRAAEIKTRVAPPLPAAITAQLRPYQLEGFHFLAYLAANRFGGILADDMGLGKTLQVIAALVRAHDRGELGERGPLSRGPVLVVAPTSVVGTWMGELETFAPHLPAVAVTATERKRGTTLAEPVAGTPLEVDGGCPPGAICNVSPSGEIHSCNFYYP